MDKPFKKNRSKIKQATKIRSLLQREINSTCPLCDNIDVEHFQIHHIDENPGHNHIENLILICPNCHSKITKGDILQKFVEQTKLNLPSLYQIECASISIDEDKCSWINYEGCRSAFIDDENDKNPNPIISFSLINHSSKTILLKEINLKIIHLYSGLAGPPDFSQPGFLKSMAFFKMELPDESEIGKFKLKEEIEVPASRALKFDIEVYRRFSDMDIRITGRKHLLFSFQFNNNIILKAPTIFLNCNPGEDDIELLHLT